MASSRSATVRTEGGGSNWSGWAGVVAVEAEQGVEVDRPAGLVLGGLAVRDAYRVDQAVFAVAAGNPDREHATAAGELAEAAFDGLLGAPPEFACLVVPDDVGGVVVAVRAQRLAELGIAGAVPGEARVVTVMWAAARITAGMTGLRPACAAGPVSAGVLADRPGVDRAERRGGEGDEHGRVPGDVGGDAFAADEPGAEEVVGVAAVGLGAAGAGGGAPVPACLVDGPVGHADRGDGAQQLAGRGVDVLDVAAQPDGPGTARRRARCDRARRGIRRGAVRRRCVRRRARGGYRVRCSPPCPEPCGFRA